jgi:membrane-bound serine protease (ClpP class)
MKITSSVKNYRFKVIPALIWLVMSLSWLPSCITAQEQLSNPFEPLDEPAKNTAASSPNLADQQPNADSAEVSNASMTPEVSESPPQAPAVRAPQPIELPVPAPGGQRLPQVLVERESLLTEQFKKPYLIEVDGPITGFFDWYISKSLEQARRNQADLVIIKLTTPGGELDLSLQLARKLLGIQWAKTVIWIPQEAISGGAIMSLGADAIYMRESAMFGDAGPVYLTPWGDMVHAEEKIVSYTAESIRQLARDAGRPVEIAAAMADRKLKVFTATEKATGRKAFLSELEAKTPQIADQFEVGAAVAEAGNDRFLTVSGERAQQLLLSDALFDSEAEMLKALSSEPPVRITIHWKDRWIYRLNRPFWTGLILIVGIVSLYFEFTIPGATLPGLISLLCFGTFFWSHILGGTAGGLEIVMFVMGAVCMLLELFVFPGFGVFGIAGFGLIGTSLLLATQDFVLPTTAQQWQQLQGNGLSILLAGIVLACLIIVQVFWLDSIPGFSRLQLKPEEQAHLTPTQSAHPASMLQLGVRGTTMSDLRPSGKAMLDGHVVDVLSEGDYVERGTDVSIIRIEGNVITVRRVNP